MGNNSTRTAIENYRDAPLGQFPLSVANLGSVAYDDQGRPSLNLGGSASRAQGMFSNLRNLGAQGAAALDPGLRQTGQQALSASQGILRGVGAFNPEQQAQTRFGRLQSILAPDRERARSSLESRLLAQGRLDSSGGALQYGEQERAFAAEDAALLDRMYAEAEGQRTQEIQNADLLANTGGRVATGLFAQAQAAEQSRQGEYSPLFQLLNASNALEQQKLGRFQNVASLQLGRYGAQGGGGGGSGALGAIGTIGGGIIGGMYGGAAGATAGAQIGGSLGSLF